MTDSVLKQNLRIKLSWNNLTLVQKSQAKTILNHLSGQIKSGQFLTIMGSSGAGKSTFLSLLTKSFQSLNRKFSLKGSISLNNQPYTEDDFYSVASYVPQDDLLLQTLTVQEVFDFQASLKLHNRTVEERKQAINSVLRLLNLYEVRNAFIGGNGKKSISGGQRKRVAIGIQLISNPMIMILDEPTSGLDSSNSLKIIKFLSRLAKYENKLIIATIHQPSTLMFNNLDKLMILHKGSQIFLEQAAKIVTYMESLDIKVDERMNPADFFMLQISSFKQNQKYTTPMTSQNFRKYKLNQKQLNPEIQDPKSEYDPINYADQRSAPLTSQLRPLLIRNKKNFIRNPSNQGGRFMQLIVFPFLIGTIFFDLMDRSPFKDPSFPMQTFLLERISFFYIGLFFTLLQSVYDTLLAFPTEKQLVLKEVHSRMYYMSAFYISKLIIELPLMFLSVIVSCSTVFLIIGFENTLEFWLYWIFSFSFVAFGGYMIGVCIGVMCKSQFYAVQAGVMIMMPVMTFGGQGVNLNTIPSYASWMQYLTPLRYGYNILMRENLSSEECGFMGDDPKVQDFVGLKGEPIDSVVGLILLCYGLTVLSFVLLYAKRKLG